MYYLGLVEVEKDQIKDVHFIQPSNIFDYSDEFIEFKNAHGWQ